MRLKTITLTGADDNTKHLDMMTLTKKYPRVEWGILIGGSLDKSRYPSDEWMKELSKWDLPISVHVCGKWSRELLEGKCPPHVKMLNAQRVQLNCAFGKRKITNDVIKKAANVTAQNGAKLILQVGNPISTLYHHPPTPHMDVLFDASGGRGQEIKELPKPVDNIGWNGYAGGIGLDNLTPTLDKINIMHGLRNSWIDMESKLRKDDKFDLDTCEEILQYCHALF